jgi:hypothetical protein
MGNCYSETPGAEITIQDANAIHGRPNRLAMAEFAEDSARDQPQVDIEEVERQIVSDT